MGWKGLPQCTESPQSSQVRVRVPCAAHSPLNTSGKFGFPHVHAVFLRFTATDWQPVRPSRLVLMSQDFRRTRILTQMLFHLPSLHPSLFPDRRPSRQRLPQRTASHRALALSQLHWLRYGPVSFSRCRAQARVSMAKELRFDSQWLWGPPRPLPYGN